jgi:hypothetical protein
MKTISPSVAAPYLPKTRFKPFWRWYEYYKTAGDLRGIVPADRVQERRITWQ